MADSTVASCEPRGRHGHDHWYRGRGTVHGAPPGRSHRRTRAVDGDVAHAGRAAYGRGVRGRTADDRCACLAGAPGHADVRRADGRRPRRRRDRTRPRGRIAGLPGPVRPSGRRRVPGRAHRAARSAPGRRRAGRSTVGLVEGLAGHAYRWTAQARQTADELDFVARVAELSPHNRRCCWSAAIGTTRNCAQTAQPLSRHYATTTRARTTSS